MTPRSHSTSFCYSPEKNLLYKSALDQRFQEVLGRVSDLYRNVRTTLEIPSPPEPVNYNYYSSVTHWHDDFLFWHMMTHPYSFGSNYSSGISGTSFRGSKGDHENCLAIAVVFLIMSLLVALGFSSYATYQEGKSAKKSQELKEDILQLHNQLQNLHIEGQDGIHSSLQNIERWLDTNTRHKKINTALGTLGTVGLALLITSLTIYLLDIYHVPTHMPLEIISCVGGSAIGLSLLGLIINSCYQKKIPYGDFQDSWNRILENSAIPTVAIENFHTLHYHWFTNSGSQKFFIKSTSPTMFSIWTIETDLRNPARDSFILNHYCGNHHSQSLLDQGFLPAE